MTLSLFTPLLQAAALAVLAYLAGTILFRPRQAKKHLSEYFAPAQSNSSKVVPTGSLEHKIRLAAMRYRLDATGREKPLYYAAIVILTLAIAALELLLRLPAILLLAAPVLGFGVVRGQLNTAWHAMRHAIERELPTFLLRMAATIQATPNVPEAIADVTASLDPSGPLFAWMSRLQAAIQTGGRRGLDDLQAEAGSISPSLLLVVLELARLWETGGSGYGEAFRLASTNLASILEGRASAAAKADGAWGTVRIILLALGGSLVVAMSSSAGSGLFSTPAVQLGLVLVVAWAALGWSVIGDTIREVTE